MRLESLAESWSLDLRVQRKSSRTIETYLRAVDQLSKFLEDPDIDQVATTDIRRFLDWHLTNNSDSTARQRYGSLSVFFSWLVKEGEICSGCCGIAVCVSGRSPVSVSANRPEKDFLAYTKYYISDHRPLWSSFTV